MFESFAESVDGFFHKSKLTFMSAIGIAARKGLGGLGALVLPVGYAANLWVSQSDYKYNENKTKSYFAAEISAKTRKRADQLTTEDFEQIADSNPTLAEDRENNKNNRNMHFGLTSTALTIAYCTLHFFPPLVALELGFLASALVGGAIFIAAEKLLEPFAEKIFKVDEPKMSEVFREPALQCELSVPSQVKYLAYLQQNINPRDPRSLIKPEQVASVFAKANPDNIPDNNYIEQLTSDLNERLVRAQELAFTVYGQQSGVAKLESRQLNALERAHEELQHKLAVAQDKIGELSEHAKEKAKTIGQTAMAKMGFNKSSVEGTIPENQEKLGEVMKENSVEKPSFISDIMEQGKRNFSPSDIIASRGQPQLAGATI